MKTDQCPAHKLDKVFGGRYGLTQDPYLECPKSKKCSRSRITKKNAHQFPADVAEVWLKALKNE